MSRWETRILYPLTTADKTWTQPGKATKSTQVRPRRTMSTNEAPKEDETVIYQRVQSTHDHKKDQLRKVVSSVAEQLVTELRQEIIQAVNLEGCSGSSDHMQDQEQTSGTSLNSPQLLQMNLGIRIDMVKIMLQRKSESAYASIRKRTTVDEASKQTETAIQATQERFKRSRSSNNPPQEDETVIYQRHQSTHELQEDRLKRVASSEAEKRVVPELGQENIQAVNLERDLGSVDHVQEQKQASGLCLVKTMPDEGLLYRRFWFFFYMKVASILRLFIDVIVLNNNSLESFLNDNKHLLFHMLKPSVRCCRCSKQSPASSFKRSFLTEQQMKLLYDMNGNLRPGHQKVNGTVITQFCLCQIKATSSNKIANLDITMMLTIIQTCLPKMYNKLLPHFDLIRSQRNELAQYETNGMLSEADYDRKWNQIEIAILNIVSEIDYSHRRYEENEITCLKNMNVSNEEISEQLKFITLEQTPMNEENNEEIEENRDEDYKRIERLLFKMCNDEYDVRIHLNEVTNTRRSKFKRFICRYKHHLSDNDQERRTISGRNETCYIKWKIETADETKVETVVSELEMAADYMDTPFRIKFVRLGSLVIGTTVKRRILQNNKVLRRACKKFLKELQYFGEISTNYKVVLKIEAFQLDKKKFYLEAGDDLPNKSVSNVD